jgi:hypothetical protein
MTKRSATTMTNAMVRRTLESTIPKVNFVTSWFVNSVTQYLLVFVRYYVHGIIVLFHIVALPFHLKRDDSNMRHNA